MCEPSVLETSVLGSAGGVGGVGAGGGGAGGAGEGGGAAVAPPPTHPGEENTFWTELPMRQAAIGDGDTRVPVADHCHAVHVEKLQHVIIQSVAFFLPACAGASLSPTT